MNKNQTASVIFFIMAISVIFFVTWFEYGLQGTELELMLLQSVGYFTIKDLLSLSVTPILCCLPFYILTRMTQSVSKKKAMFLSLLFLVAFTIAAGLSVMSIVFFIGIGGMVLKSVIQGAD